MLNNFRAKIRDVHDFPKPGIVFKDITPVLADAALCKALVDELASHYRKQDIQVIAGIESRGFLFGMLLAYELNIPFVPVRKAGKLPFRTISTSYELEYGEAVIEMHEDAIRPHDRVLIHDDLLATGGTAAAAAKLIGKLQGQVAGFSFLIDLTFLQGKEVLRAYSDRIHAMVAY